MMNRIVVLLIVAILGLAAGCRSLPEPDDERAVYVDLRQVVETRQRGEWIVDDKEIAEARPKAMQTVCRVSPDTVESLDGWLDERLRVEGGAPAEQFERGVDLGELDEVLTLHRVQALARRANTTREQCPFWTQPDSDFAGIHRPTDRFVLLAESAGLGSLTVQGDQRLLGAGGAGRLLAGWGFGHRLLVGVGGEFGGTAGLEPLQGESVQEEIETRIQAAVPVLFRVHDLARIYDFELAATAISSPVDFDPDYGLRAQVGAGVLTVRIGDILPYFLLTAGYEVLPWQEPAIHIMRLGTRFGVDYAPM